MSLKDTLKQSFVARYLIRKLRARRFARRPRAEVFADIHRQNAWGSAESISGPGSELAQTRAIRGALPALVNRLGVHTFLDAPCGDFHWMQEVDLGRVDYVGVDIVPALIAENQRQFRRAPSDAAGSREFLQSDLVAPAAPLPAADLVMCRDCLMHLSFEEARAVLANLCGTGADHLLITTFPGSTRNADIGRGGWWPMNLELSPFHFPPPLELIAENPPDPEAQRLQKSVGLWPRHVILKSLGR
ncbi:MAG TPA: class I SAM-dependent methyltransferase [Phycisphaerae bacterium]|nr:class I SAM-dependent methyltransferase [Phycisphaerae bacterium]